MIPELIPERIPERLPDRLPDDSNGLAEAGLAAYSATIDVAAVPVPIDDNVPDPGSWIEICIIFNEGADYYTYQFCPFDAGIQESTPGVGVEIIFYTPEQTAREQYAQSLGSLISANFDSAGCIASVNVSGTIITIQLTHSGGMLAFFDHITPSPDHGNAYVVNYRNE